MSTKRPESLTGTTRQSKGACGTVHVTINENEFGTPIECFIHVGKAGGCASAQAEASARIIAWGLRSGADLVELTEQLRGITCHNAEIEAGKPSCAHAVALAIEKYLKGKPDGTV